MVNNTGSRCSNAHARFENNFPLWLKDGINKHLCDKYFNLKDFNILMFNIAINNYKNDKGSKY